MAPGRQQLGLRTPPPGGTLLHPVALCALAALILNDHVLKADVPGWWTGKISDVAGLIVFPLALHSVLQLGAAWRGSRRRLPDLPMICLGVAVAFAAVELVAPVAVTYSVVLGALQWVAASALSLATGASADFQLVQVTADATDLLALPSVAVAMWIGRPRPSPALGLGSRRLALAMLVVASAASLATSYAPPSVRASASRQFVVPPGGTTASWAIRVHATAEAMASRDTSTLAVHFADGAQTLRAVELRLTRFDTSGAVVGFPMRVTYDQYGQTRQPILGHCGTRGDCEALYRLDATWDPAADGRIRSLEVTVSVALEYEPPASVPPGADVSVELGEVPDE